VLSELVIRFIIGGAVVCAFALIGDVLQPKSFAGIFGAAPSVALATLGLTFAKHGGSYVSIEGSAMIAGAVGLFAYSFVSGRLLIRKSAGAVSVSSITMIVWAAISFGIWAMVLR
jgi:hypothetical protein